MIYIDADKIRTEIKRLKAENNCGTDEFIAAKDIAYDKVFDFLDTLEEPVTDCHDLEDEIREYMSNEDNNPFDWDWRDKRDCARHFAEWGAEHLAGVRKMIEPEKKEGE